ncbi:hypothetical protein X772_22255 [Mesorhizobium sp. LSJC280B00]|nr:hypothetical protein X772_22255 [Mesorhizobium sp. LSJC280B00]
MQDDPGDLSPVRLLGRGVEQANVGKQTLFVVSGQNRRSGSLIGDVRVEQTFAHRRFSNPVDASCKKRLAL